ncbi:MAG: hypothetical protein AAF433_02105 [Bacteroidota bacterium]
MLYKNFLVGLLFICYFSNCGEETVGEPQLLNCEPIDNIVYSANYGFNPLGTNGLAEFEVEGRPVLASLSGEQIFVFDIEDGTLNREFTVPTEGKYKIEALSEFDGMVVAPDSSIIYSSNRLNTIYLIQDSIITKLHSFDVEGDDIRLVSNFQCTPIYANNKAIFSTFRHPASISDTKRAFVTVNSQKGFELKEIIPFSNLYFENFYSTQPYFYWAAIRYCPWRNSFLVSFPVDNRIWEYDEFFNLLGTVNASSTLFSEVVPFSEPVSADNLPDPQLSAKYFRETSHFCGLMVNEQERKVYRMTRYCIPLEDGSFDYQYSLIALNEELDIDHEFILPDSHTPYTTYAYGQGIQVFNQNAYNEVGDTVFLPFSTFDCD